MGANDKLGELGEFRLKGEGHWSGVMQRFTFRDKNNAFAAPEPYTTDGDPLPYTVDFHRCGLDTYRVATTWGGALQGTVEEHALGRGDIAASSAHLDLDEAGDYR
jgi:hypothetical protein